MSDITDKESHFIQNEIDLVMDMIRDKVWLECIDKEIGGDLCDRLEGIRDSIPCSCDQN